MPGFCYIISNSVRRKSGSRLFQGIARARNSSLEGGTGLKSTRNIECISYRDFKKLMVSNLPDSVSEAVMVIVDREGTVLYASGYKKVLGFDDLKIVNKKLARVEPRAKVLQMLQMDNPYLAVGDNVLPSLGNLRVEGAVIPLWSPDNKLVGGLTIFVPQNRVEVLRDIVDKIKTSAVTVNTDEIIRGNEIPLRNNRRIIGASEAYRKVVRLALQAARTDFDVLITGETGVGKELLAEFIHLASPRRNGPLVVVNCAAVPETLLESELFGYEAGAFTGASRFGKQGKFELADGGTLFLDEIGEMSLATQGKLLRAIQEREIEKVGGTRSKPVNIRVIAATNRNLEEMVERGNFRKDLFYRLNVIPVIVPPLRSRREDISVLFDYFLGKIERKTGIRITFSERLMKQFLKYRWPGNVRELENICKYASVLAYERSREVFELDLDDLAFRLGHALQSEEECGSVESVTIKAGLTLSALCEETERKAILTALSHCNYNKSSASRMLGITRQALYQKARQYGIGI